MNQRVLELAKRALKEDIFPSSVYVPAKNLNPEIPMDCAVFFRQYLLSQPLAVIEGEKLGGVFRYANAIPLDHSEREQTENVVVEMPTDLYSKIGFSHITAFFRKHSDYIPDSAVCFLDWDHYCTNYPYMLKHGMKGYLDRIELSKAAHKGNKEQLDFLEAMEYALETMHLYLDKVADFYKENGRENIAAVCRKVPWNRPESFKEAVQAYWSIWVFLPDSLARIDQYLNPFYVADLNKGLITKEEAEELIGEMFVKCFAWRPGGGFTEHRSADVTFSIAGYDEYGEDGFNEMSKVCIESLAALPTWRPQCNVRVNKKTPSEVFRYITKYNKIQPNIVFTNDDVRIPAFIKMGIPYDDAVGYTMVGCNEWTMVGKGHTGSQGFFNPLKAMERALVGVDGALNALESFDDFYEKYELCLKEDIFKMMDLADAYYDECVKDISVVTSIFVEDCIDKARSLTASGQRYSTSNWSCTGFADAIDSLIAIKHFVYDKSRFTLAEMTKMTKQNWEGFEVERQEIISANIYWGNDIDSADAMEERFVASLEKICNLRTPKKGGVFRFGSYVGYNYANVTMGNMTGATPNGRYANQYISDGMGAGRDKQKNGLTAYLKSVAKIDNSFFIGPTATNITIDEKMADTEEKLDKLSSIYETFIRLGGLQLQPTYIKAGDLEKAQKMPDDYKDLRVRVTGYSGFFTRLDDGTQDEIIHRYRANEDND